MFELMSVNRRRAREEKFSGPFHAAVDLSRGMVIPFTDKEVAENNVKAFNKGKPTTVFHIWPSAEVWNATTGKPLRPEALDAESNLVILTILQNNFLVHPEVARHVTELRAAVTAASLKIAALEGNVRVASSE